MASVTLGATPTHMDLELVPGGDFVCTLVSQDGDWPATAVITIEVGDAVWTATLAGPEARFEVDQAQVDAVVAAKPYRFMLWYTDGGSRLPWAAGAVTVYG